MLTTWGEVEPIVFTRYRSENRLLQYWQHFCMITSFSENEVQASRKSFELKAYEPSPLSIKFLWIESLDTWKFTRNLWLTVKTITAKTNTKRSKARKYLSSLHFPIKIAISIEINKILLSKKLFSSSFVKSWQFAWVNHDSCFQCFRTSELSTQSQSRLYKKLTFK